MTAWRDFVINQGVTFEEVFTVYDKATGLPRVLTGYTARMQARLTVDAVTPLFNIVPTIDGPNGIITITIPKATTLGFTWKQGRYDLEIDNTVKAERILQGYISVSREVTHD